MNDKQEFIIDKLNEIENIAKELMNMAVIGEDGNLKEMAYHIKCYSNKIIVHLLKEWKNNIKFVERKVKKQKEQEEEKQQENEEVQQLMEKISEMFRK